MDQMVEMEAVVESKRWLQMRGHAAPNTRRGQQKERGLLLVAFPYLPVQQRHQDERAMYHIFLLVVLARPGR